MFFTVVLRVVEKHLIADAVIMDSMMQFQRKEKKDKKGAGHGLAKPT